jgi:large subunit ribosomal protein L2
LNIEIRGNHMKHYKPTTPSRRHMTGIEYRKFLTTSKPEKSLTVSTKSKAGRSGGRISTRHQGGRHKRRYRLITLSQDNTGLPGLVETIEYDPFRTAFIAKIKYPNGKRAYALAPQGLLVGSRVTVSDSSAPNSPGNRMPLKSIPVGASVYNIELNPGQGGKLVRSAGLSAQVMAHDSGFVHVQLPSGEIRKIQENCFASIGELSNPEHRMVTIGKAGRSRWKGVRPTVRGSAMNPVDHPLGGGEGRAPAGLRRPKNLWGKGIRGVKTRKSHKPSGVFIVRSRKKKSRR